MQGCRVSKAERKAPRGARLLIYVLGALEGSLDGAGGICRGTRKSARISAMLGEGHSQELMIDCTLAYVPAPKKKRPVMRITVDQVQSIRDS